jgi:hypothetical protein
MGQKNSKGSVSIENTAGRLRLRWRYQSKRYSLNLFSYSKANLLQAKKIAHTIENDMVVGDFDFTLSRYGKTITDAQPEKKSIVQHFEQWVKSYRHMDCDRHVHYHATRNMMLRWGTFDENNVVHKLNGEKFNERTYNGRLAMLKKFFIWLLKQKVIQINPLEDVQLYTPM